MHLPLLSYSLIPHWVVLTVWLKLTVPERNAFVSVISFATGPSYEASAGVATKSGLIKQAAVLEYLAAQTFAGLLV